MSGIRTHVARLGAGLLLAGAALGTVGVLPASAVDAVTSMTVEGSVASDGALSVTSTLTLRGTVDQLQQRFALTGDAGREGEYVYAISDVKASVGGTAVTPTVTQSGNAETVTVPVGKSSEPVTISYTVRGAARDLGKDVTELNWPLLQGLALPVERLSATVKVPGAFTSISCYAGDPEAPGTCGYFAGGTHEAPDPTFHDEGRAPGEVVGAVLRFKSSVVKPDAQVRQLWSLDRAFSADPLPLGLALLAAVVGGGAFWLLHRRFGSDAVAPAPTVLGSFKPVGPGQSEFDLVGEIRPGEVGTLADERVDPIDVTATVIDLAVRNHLLITQLPRASEFAPTEWTLRRCESAAALAPFEKTLLDAVAPATGERRLSECAGTLSAAVPAIQAQLYDAVVAKGWFASRPDQTRGRWSRIGWVSLLLALGAAGLLVAFTPFGLLGLVLVALGASVGVLGQVMPARTAKGSSALAGLGVLRGTLLTQPTDELPEGREHEELARVLPYAVVLGGAERWLDGLASVNDPDVDDATELSWYHGPDGWQLSDLPDSLRSFIRAFAGTLVGRG